MFSIRRRTMDWPAAVPEKNAEWATEVPEKKADQHVGYSGGIPVVGTNKFLVDLVSGGAVAALAKTAFSSNLSSIIRYAPPRALSLAFKEKYKNYFLEGVDRNERFSQFFTGNLKSGAAAGATTLCIVRSLEHVAAGPAVRISRLQRRGNKEGLIGRLVKTAKSPEMYKGIIGNLPGAFVLAGFDEIQKFLH